MSIKCTTRALLALIVAAPIALSQANAQMSPVPAGWYPIGADPSQYRIGTEPARRPGGDGWSAATIKFVGAEPTGAALLQQSIRADDVRGKRVRLTGWMKSAPDTYAQLWMRVDGPKGTESSDYMLRRPLLGATDWAPASIVLDVPHDAIGITFGMMLTGAGQVWLDDMSFETVGLDVAITGHEGHEIEAVAKRRLDRSTYDAKWSTQRIAYRTARLSPINLSFESVASVAIR